MDAEITLRFSSVPFARSLKKAIAPDNKMADQRMRISATVKGRSLTVKVSDCEGLETLAATLQDIFRCIRAAELSLSKLAEPDDDR